MGLTAILRGFRIPVAALDRFLKANGLMPTFGGGPYPSLIEETSNLLRTKLGDDSDDSRIRLFIPSRKLYLSSDVAYIAYNWVMVLRPAPDQVRRGAS